MQGSQSSTGKTGVWPLGEAAQAAGRREAWPVGSGDLNPAFPVASDAPPLRFVWQLPESSLEKAFLRQIEGMMRSRTFNCLSSCAAASLSLPLHTGAILRRCRMLLRFALRNNT
jgi:hypothetical protein